MKVYGLIGNPLGHSFSPGYFNEKFLRENLPAYQYELFPLQSAVELVSVLNDHPEIYGLNVTLPFKKEVFDLMDELDPVAVAIGAVNTIKIVRSKNKLFLKGYNTDAFGFQLSCIALQNLPKAIVLGTGGSAQAVKYILWQYQILCISVSRTPSKVDEISYQDITEAMVREHPLIINTTPLGMFPNIDQCPPFPYSYLTENNFLYDLIYNPDETLFLKQGRRVGAKVQNGELMLELQAERSWEIWNA